MVTFGFAFNNLLFSDWQLLLDVGAVESPVALSSNDVEDDLNNKHMEKLHVSSVILAAHSDYFMRLFSNGMSEASTKTATVKVTEEEKQGLYNLVEYMYTGRLSEPSDAESTITLLCLADRFAISSCMESLAEILKRFPCTVRDSLLILGLPESLKTDKTVKPVVEHYRDYLAQQFSDISVRQIDFLSLSIEGVKVVLDSDALLVSYEEEVFYHLLDWLDANCQNTEEKIKAAEEIAEMVRFPWMTGDFLVDIVLPNPCMQSNALQVLVMDAIKFKSFTHSRQQLMIWKKNSHSRYRPRNTLILENFWGNSKTFTIRQTDRSCQVYFEFPLELVICTGQNFQSRPFSLGGKYTFYLEARHGQVKISYNQQLTCCISLVLPPSSVEKVGEEKSSCILEYLIAMKRDYSQSYDTKAAGSVDLQSAEFAGTCITFNDFFSGWFIERGFSFPRWNLTINGPVFLRMDLTLKEAPGHQITA